MNNWYSVSLGDGITAVSPTAELESLFQQHFVAAGKPAAMAVFTRPESEGRLYCEIIAYFSPAASLVAEAFEAEPCPKPERGGLGLLAGTAEAWSVWFGESAD